MRRNFAEILRGAGVNVAAEYRSLYMLVFQRYGFYSYVKSQFESVPFRGTCVTLDDFNGRFGFDFGSVKETLEEDKLLSFCEYAYNLAKALTYRYMGTQNPCPEVISHVELLAEKLNYMFVDLDGLFVLVPKNEGIAAAAEVAPDDGSATDLVTYDWRGYEGNIDAKRAILLRLLASLEPRKRELGRLSKSLETDLFFIANNLGIRHNNTNPNDPGKYKQVVAELDAHELERWYDFCRDMCAAAFLLLSYEKQQASLEDLKKSCRSEAR